MYRWAAAAIVTILFLLGVDYYGGRLVENQKWVSALSDYPETRLVERSFELIADTRLQPPLLTLEAVGSSEIALTLASCEERAGATGDRAIAMELLCNSPYGERIRDDVAAWNAAHRLLAVRDNRSKNGQCEDDRDAGLESNAIYLPAGCKPGHWTISRKLAGAAASVVRLVPNGAPSLEEFAVVLADDPASEYQSDWATIDGGRDENAAYTLESRDFPVERDAPVAVEVAGRLRSAHVEFTFAGASRVVDLDIRPDAEISTREADGLRLESRRLCADAPLQLQERAEQAAKDEGKSDPDFSAGSCDAEPPQGAGVPVAYALTLSRVGEAKKGDVAVGRISLVASPVTLPLEAIAAAPALDFNTQLAEAAAEDDEAPSERPKEEFRTHRLGHLSAECPLAAARWGQECRLSWNTQELRRGGTHHETIDIGLLDSPGVSLVDPKSQRIGAHAFDLGLTDVLGLEASDYGALIWALARNGGGKAQLTISEPMQQAVEDVLTGGEAGCARTGRGARFERLCAKLKPEQHTATIVLMDADRAPGEIRAVASWPSLPKHRNIWDLRGLEVARKANAGLAWRQLLPGQRPGSTFKAVTAYAAVEAATRQGDAFPLSDPSRADLSTLLTGAMPLHRAVGVDQASFLGLASAEGKGCAFGGAAPDAVVGRAHEKRYAWCVHNAGGTPYEAESEVPGAGGCPVKVTGKNERQMSLCEAIKHSSNLYFGGVAHILAKSDPKRPTLALEDIARRLSFPPEPCPGAAPGSPDRCGFDLTRGQLGGHAPLRLRADPIAFDERSGPEAMRHERDTVLSGFGDAQSATPLAVTTLYASLASGRVVRPSILVAPRDANGCPTKPEPGECGAAFPASPEFSALFELVRAGMKAVVSNSGGTAFGRFGAVAPMLPRIYAKTGTATYRGRTISSDTDSPVRELNALWLVGWIEGDGSNGPLGHRLAFGCHISGGLPGQFGAAFCGPAIRDVLLALSRSPGR